MTYFIILMKQQLGALDLKTLFAQGFGQTAM
jgi:hypothetical protein